MSKRDETSLALRAVWLHLIGGLTQLEVSARLGISKLKAHRLISHAMSAGIVKVFIEGEVAECVRLENQLMDKYSLSYCSVNPCIDTEPLPVKTLGYAGAKYLNSLLEKPDECLIGIGHGRTLASVSEYLPKKKITHKKFVSLLGGLSRKFIATPYDVIHQLASKTEADAFVMPLPIVANSTEDKSVLMSQRGVSEIFQIMQKSDVMLAGIGSTAPTAYLIQSSIFTETEFEEIRSAGGEGELLGSFFSSEGQIVRTALTDRIISLDFESMKNQRIIGIAGGVRKAHGIKAVLKSSILQGLITDEQTANLLVS